MNKKFDKLTVSNVRHSKLPNYNQALWIVYKYYVGEVQTQMLPLSCDLLYKINIFKENFSIDYSAQ